MVTLHSFLTQELEAAGYVVYNQTYTHHDPITNEVKAGANLYATHWSHRTDRTEAYLMHAPTVHSTNTALALGLARFFCKHEIWSRNLIVLFTQDEYIGTDAFLSVYNRVPTRDGLHAGPLSGSRAGDIHSAISLQFNKARMANVVLATTGINGQKPNMDLVQASFICANRPSRNVDVRLAEYENLVEGNSGINPMVSQHKDSAGFLAARLLTLLESAKLAGSCKPDGGHAIFLKHGIEAVTFRASKARGDKKLQVAPFKLVEGVFRVLNNLVQKFNQCYYFYLHVDGARSHYLPFTVYIGPLLAGCVVLILRALCNWYGYVPAGEGDADCGADAASTQIQDANGAEMEHKANSNDDGNNGVAAPAAPAPAKLWRQDDRCLRPVLLLVVATYVACIGGLLSVGTYLPSIYEQIDAGFKPYCKKRLGGNIISTDPTVVLLCQADTRNVAAAVSLTLAVVGSWLGHRLSLSVARMGGGEKQLSWDLVEAFVDLFTSFILGTVTALNAAMAAPAVLLLLPLATVFSFVAAGSRICTLAAWIVLACTSPPALVGGGLYATAFPANEFFALVVRNHAVFSTWILPLFFGGYLPMYILALSCATSKLLKSRAAGGHAKVQPL